MKYIFALCLLGVLMDGAGVPAAAASPAAAAPISHAVGDGMVRFDFEVQGCDRCAVTPIQMLRDGRFWQGNTKKPSRGQVRYVLPRDRTRALGFIVDPPFRTSHDPLGRDFPVMVITQFRGQRPNTPIPWRYAQNRRSVSGCLSGVTAQRLQRTLHVRRVLVGGEARASAYLSRTVASDPLWVNVTKASRHLADPSICAQGATRSADVRHFASPPTKEDR